MSYQQYFDVKHDADNETQARMAAWMGKLHNGSVKAEILTGEFEEPMTWSSFEEDMTKLSREFPKVLFTIEITDCEEPGCDEEARMWIRGGNSITHRPQVIWPDPPDLERLR